MLDICPPGTGSMTPLPYRQLTSMMTRYNGSSLLIDYGEGTQVALRKEGWSPRSIGVICFAHYHADHINGLSGLLLTMGSAERTEPLLVIGPKGLEHVVTALRSIAPELPFPIAFSELTEAREQRTAGPYMINVYRVNRNVLCYGCCISIPRISHFDAARAKGQGIPLKFWDPLQKGQIITDGDKVYASDMVLGGARRGLKINYCTDTHPVPAIAEYTADTDLMIYEGMCSKADKQQKARERRHMTIQGAVKFVSEAKPKEPWLTHYNPSLNCPEGYMAGIRKIFPAAKAARDSWTMELVFPEEA